MDKLDEINQAIQRYYAQSDVVSPELIEATFYSVEVGGKRIRPLIFLEILEGFGTGLTEDHFDVAAALEMIHTGNLTHDDLPAMDNDDHRRGCLTNHKKFDEATAILAGDSLFLDSFGLVANVALSVDTKVRLVAELSQASGTYSMVGGQILDTRGEERRLNLSESQMIHANKTGKLLTFPVVATGIVANLAADDLKSLREVGSLVGLASQIRDDTLDVTATFRKIERTSKRDLFTDKAICPSLFGLEESYDILSQSIDQALATLQELSETQAFNTGKIIGMIEKSRLHA